MKTTDQKKKSPKVISSLKNNIKDHEHHVRQRAFEIFQDREEYEGTETTDWFQAKHELYQPNENM